jgi:hypothetical protein
MPSQEEAMEPPSSSWKYEAGLLTVFHAGNKYELGYFKFHEDVRKAALAFFAKHGGRQWRRRGAGISASGE